MEQEWEQEVDRIARAILHLFNSMQFEQYCPLSRRFEDLPKDLGIYAFRHRAEGILYIGKAGGNGIRSRLRAGHKALCWAFLDRHDPDDVRVTAIILSDRAQYRIGAIETRMLVLTRPRYNIRIG